MALEISKTLGIEITTAKVGGLRCETNALAPYPGFTYKIFNADGDEVTDPAQESTATRTEISFEPPYDYELMNGSFQPLAAIPSDLRLWLIAAPDIAPPQGSFEAVTDVNLRFTSPGSQWRQTSEKPGTLRYDAATHSGKIKAVMRHAAGLQVTLEMILQVKIL